MQKVLADLCHDSESATAGALRLARAYDEDDRANRRIGTAVLKYWVCKATPPLVAEALECLGGNGYVEESALPRLLRESPLNSIWEGSGNVNCLDVLRAARREPDAVRALLAEIDLAAGGDRRLDAAAARLRDELADEDEAEARARRIVELAALCLQGSLLVRHAPPEVADAFCATRLGGEGGRAYGTLPAGADCPAIVERHRPRLDA
jgi:putative acyl-CoA dehydrogenase